MLKASGQQVKVIKALDAVEEADVAAAVAQLAEEMAGKPPAAGPGEHAHS